MPFVQRAAPLSPPRDRAFARAIPCAIRRDSAQPFRPGLMVGLGLVLGLGLGLGLVSGCGPQGSNPGSGSRSGSGAAPSTSAPSSTPTSKPPPTPPQAWFRQDPPGPDRLTFVHAAEVSGRFLFPEIMGSGVALLDANQDGRLDLFLIHNVAASAPERNQLLLQEPDGRLRDATAGSGLERPGRGQGLAIADLTHDGLPEILITEADGLRLFLNRGQGRFTDVTAEAGLTNRAWSIPAAFFDYDRDGWLDLVVGHYLDFDPDQRCLDARGQPDYCGPQGFRPTLTRLFRHRGTLGPDRVPRFEDVTLASGLARAPGKAMQIVCADFDGDRWPDVFVSDDALPNRLFVNRRDGTFREEALERGLAYPGLGAPAANMGVALADFDHNGLFDLFIPHLGEESHTLWRQSARGLFEDATAQAGLLSLPWHGTGFGTVAGDFDNDTSPDLAIVNGRIRRPHAPVNPAATARGIMPGIAPFWTTYAEPAQLFANDGTGRLREISAANPDLCGEAFVGRGIATGDFDNDGGLDLVITGIGGPARLLRNVAPRGHWLGVRAVDPARGGRDALGAEILVQAGGRMQWRLAHPAQSYASSLDPRVHFGLGPSDRYDALLVRWPDGTDEWFPGGPADRYLTLRQGSGRTSAPSNALPIASSSAQGVAGPAGPAGSGSAGTPGLTRTIANANGAGAAADAPPATHLLSWQPPASGLDPAISRLLTDSLAATRLAPESAAAWGRLGSAWMLHEFPREAAGALREAARLAPDDPRWPHLHALLVMNDQPEAALALLREAVRRSGVRVPGKQNGDGAVDRVSRLRLAQFLAERGHVDEAAAAFQHPDIAPLAPARLGLARLRWQQGRREDAMGLLTAGPCRDDVHTRRATHEALAMMFRASQQTNQATAAARQAAALPPDRSWPDPFWEEAAVLRTGLKHRLEQAGAWLDEGRPEAAIELLTASTRDYPSDAEGWYLLGWAWNQLRQPTRAEEALREHLKRVPSSAKGLAQLGVALLSQRRWAEARSILEQGARLKPGWREFHANLGYVARQLGQSEEAIRHYQTATECDPNHLPVHLALAELLLQADRKAEARSVVERASVLEPGNARVQALQERLR